jgi:hypothetical protein
LEWLREHPKQATAYRFYEQGFLARCTGPVAAYPDRFTGVFSIGGHDADGAMGGTPGEHAGPPATSARRIRGLADPSAGVCLDH